MAKKSAEYWASGMSSDREVSIEEKIRAKAFARAAFGRPANLKGVPAAFHDLYMQVYEEHCSAA